MKQERPPGAPGGDSAPPAPPDRLARSLRELPATEASPGFTDRVLAQVGGQAPARAAEGRRRRAALTALAGAGAAALGALVLLLRPADGPPAPALTGGGTSPPDAEVAAAGGGRDPAGIDPVAVGAELERLRQAQRDLAAAVETLRERRDPVMPVIYVGRSGDVDLILDLTRFPPPAGVKRGDER